MSEIPSPRGTASSDGFTLVEILVAMTLLAVSLLAVGSLFVFAVRERATGADLGSVGAIASERIEMLRAVSFDALTAGGTFRATSWASATRRPRLHDPIVADNASPATTKTITVRVIANRTTTGLRKEIALSTLRSR
jgi:prepilin-type N-terminal cleavage/methylation domain-containing protein